MRKDWWSIARKTGSLLPPGIIVPFMDVAANIPAEWDQFTSFSGRSVMGSVTAAGATGGNSYANRSSEWAGSHTGPATMMWVSTVGGSPGDMLDTSNQGSHYHTFRFNFAPARSWQILMKLKAGEEITEFPINAGILSDTVLPSLEDVTPTGYLLGATSGAEASSSGSSKSFSNFNEKGDHDHRSGAGGILAAGNGWSSSGYAGKHRHVQEKAPTTTDNIRRYAMGLWRSASEVLAPLPGMFAMWESAVPPDGWAICDGDNGTPDLTNYFIGFNSGAGIGTKTGNGTVTSSGRTNYDGGHEHLGSYAYYNTVSYGFHGNQADHRHTISSSANNFNPSYYTLIFIKFIGT